MKETMQLQYSFYQLFDRMGEDIFYSYTVEYDLDSIIRENYNSENFKIIPGGISASHDPYFSQYHINKEAWEKEMVEYLFSPRNDRTFEAFFENLTTEQMEEYDNKWH